ncbi:MAG: dihydroorotase, partial [Peptostreptococcaceae bacterium]
MNNILFRNVRVVDANKDENTDLLISNGKISKISKNIEVKNESVNIVDGNGYVLMPSFIDLHTHLRDPGLTHK